ncbi:MAG: hypothetical protein GY737_21795 [Desulfobacteraceae bacterium]|nr:hypothetical protein [Desulfobacteraceae bacterium]
MKQNSIFGFLRDGGGRRRIKDRRYWVAAPRIPECRTGLKRRSGLLRRLGPVGGLTASERRYPD